VGYRGESQPAAEVLLARDSVEEAAGEDGADGRADPVGDRGVGRWGYLISGDATPKVSTPFAPTLRSQQGGEGVVLWTADGPRRLTPREWELLQGFPQGYTQVLYRGRPASDAQRRRALGNAFAPPYLRWIGQRIGQWERRAGVRGDAADDGVPCLAVPGGVGPA
jgi:site-specific DNA-cytosine methylase